MKKRFFVLLSLIIGLSSIAQNTENLPFNNKRLKINKSGMIVLSAWAASNLAVSSVAWATTTGKAKYFHQMNTLWNVVNLGIALPGYFKSKREHNGKLSTAEVIREQYTTEQIYLINNALNVVYIGSGLLLKTTTKNNEQSMRWQGYGNSLILQGGFLLLFDLYQYFRHRNHRLKSRDVF